MDKIMKSKTLTIYLLVLATCHFRKVKSEIKITYVSKKLQWKEAAKYCSEEGGVLESNQTVIENVLNRTTKNSEIWVGKYESWTPWLAVSGCYKVSSGTIFKVDRHRSWDCPKLCANEDFVYFSLKNGQCVCIDSVSLLTKVKDYKPCNCCNCFQVMENIDNITFYSDNTNSSNNQCVATQCAGTEYHLTLEQCSKPYAVECENDIRFEDPSHMSQEVGATMCADNGSFIKWIPESICQNKADEVYKQQHWTSARRKMNSFKHVSYDHVDALHPNVCYKRKKGNTSSFEKDSCHEEYQFFCRVDTEAVKDDGNITYFPPCPSHLNNFGSGGANAGAIAGSVVAVLITIIVIVVGLFLYKRRKDNKIPTMRNPQPSTQTQQKTTIRDISVHDYHEINITQSQDESQSAYSLISDGQIDNEPSKSHYSFASPVYNGKCTSPYTDGGSAYPPSADSTDSHSEKINGNEQNYELAKAGSLGSQNLNSEINKIGENLAYLKSSTVNQVQNAHYSLAKPVRDSQETDPYSDNQDYDKLNSVKKKDGDTQCKVYDHLPTTDSADPTYDHTVINSPKIGDNNYDHFTFDNENI